MHGRLGHGLARLDHLPAATHCGHRTCTDHADPPRLHGPYWQWTRKVAAKTVGRWLAPTRTRTTRPYGTRNRGRRRELLLTRLETLGIAAFEAEPRWQRKPRADTAGTRPETAHNTVGTAG